MRIGKINCVNQGKVTPVTHDNKIHAKSFNIAINLLGMEKSTSFPNTVIKIKQCDKIWTLILSITKVMGKPKSVKSLNKFMYIVQPFPRSNLFRKVCFFTTLNFIPLYILISFSCRRFSFQCKFTSFCCWKFPLTFCAINSL